MSPLSRILVLVGVVLIAVGLLASLAPSMPVLGKLPGDLRIERPGIRIYVPLMSCLIASIVFCALMWFVSRFK